MEWNDTNSFHDGLQEVFIGSRVRRTGMFGCEFMIVRSKLRFF